MSSKRLQKFDGSAVNILSRHTVYKGFFALDQVCFSHQQFNGKHSEQITREVFERGDAVVVLPYDPVTDQVILIEQLRLPALRTSSTPWLLELVAGIIESGESNEDVARRELLEETGLEPISLTYVTSFLPSPGGCSERLYLYLAEIVTPEQVLSDGFGVDNEHEDIRRHVMSREQAFELVKKGIIDNAATVIGLQWLELTRLEQSNGGGSL